MNSDRILFEYFIRSHPQNATRMLERHEIDNIIVLLNELPSELIIVVFTHLSRHVAAQCLERLETKSAALIIEKLSLPKVSVILRQIKQDLRETILDTVSGEISDPLRRLLSYPEDSAAALADPLVLTVPEDITVQDALARVQKNPHNTMYYIYTVTESQVLSGVITLRKLFSARPQNKLSEYTDKQVDYLLAGFNFQAILNHPGWTSYHALPVTEENGILLGAITYETLRRIENELKKKRLPHQAVAASTALGELYQIGLSGLLRGAAAPLKDSSSEK